MKIRYLCAAFIVGLTLLISSCSINMLENKPINPICDRQEFEGSWICAQLKAYGFEYAESAMDLIIDAKDIGIILDYYTQEEVEFFTTKLITMLQDPSGITYTLITTFILDNTKKAEAVSSIIKRRFMILQSNMIINEPDIRLLIKAAEAINDSL